MNSTIIRRYYLMAIFSIAIIMSIGQLVIYYNLSTQVNDAALLNLVGRQRMLSQKLSRDLILLSETTKVDSAEKLRNAFIHQADTFFMVHRALLKERLFGDLKLNGTPQSRKALQKATKMVEEMEQIAKGVKAKNLARMSSEEQAQLEHYQSAFTINAIAFLPLMEEAMASFQYRASSKMEKTRMVLIIILVVVLVLIFAEGFLLFRPMLDKLDKTLSFLEQANRRNKEKNMALEHANKTLVQNEQLLELKNEELSILNRTLQGYTSKLKESNKALETANEALIEKERQMQDQNEALVSLNQTLTHYSQKLQNTNHELERFAYIVSHDLKAPLRAISNLSIWIEEDLEGQISEGVSKNFELLRNRVARLELLINGVLAYSRATRQNPEAVNVAFSFGKAAKDAVEQLINRNEVKIHIEGESVMLFGEPIKFSQVLNNLLSNAIKHNDKSQPEIWLSAKKVNDKATIQIRDNGPGISTEHFDKIFEIFQTLKSRDVVESTGVGLAIVKKIIEEVGGEIQVSSELGNGASFEFTWPLNAGDHA